MDFFVYCRIKDATLRDGIMTALQRIAPAVFASDDLIFIESVISPSTKVRDIVLCIQNYLHRARLHEADILYVFYPLHGREIAMYPLKRAGRVRLKTWPKDLY